MYAHRSTAADRLTVAIDNLADELLAATFAATRAGSLRTAQAVLAALADREAQGSPERAALDAALSALLRRTS